MPVAHSAPVVTPLQGPTPAIMTSLSANGGMMAQGAGTAGIGVVLQSTNASKPETVVMRLVEGGAAAFARDNGTANQLFAGDVITSVNDMSALGWSLERIKAAISGPVGTWVKVGVRRSGQKLQITLQRLKNGSQAASTASVAPKTVLSAPKQQVQAPRTPRSAQGSSSLVPIEEEKVEEKVEPSGESSGHAAEDGAGGARLTAAIETENMWRAERNALKAELAEARRKIEFDAAETQKIIAPTVEALVEGATAPQNAAPPAAVLAARMRAYEHSAPPAKAAASPSETTTAGQAGQELADLAVARAKELAVEGETVTDLTAELDRLRGAEEEARAARKTAADAQEVRDACVRAELEEIQLELQQQVALKDQLSGELQQALKQKQEMHLELRQALETNKAMQTLQTEMEARLEETVEAMHRQNAHNKRDQNAVQQAIKDIQDECQRTLQRKDASLLEQQQALENRFQVLEGELLRKEEMQQELQSAFEKELKTQQDFEKQLQAKDDMLRQQQREVLQQKLLRDEAVEEIKILKEANTQLLVTASKGERAMQDAQQIKQEAHEAQRTVKEQSSRILQLEQRLSAARDEATENDKEKALLEQRVRALSDELGAALARVDEEQEVSQRLREEVQEAHAHLEQAAASHQQTLDIKVQQQQLAHQQEELLHRQQYKELETQMQEQVSALQHDLEQRLAVSCLP